MMNSGGAKQMIETNNGLIAVGGKQLICWRKLLPVQGL